MHSCLKIDEIVIEICAFLNWSPDSKALHSMSATCTYFREPALRTIWKMLPNLVPFVKLFPRDCVGVVPDVSGFGEHLIFKRPVTSADWSEVPSYTRFVFELYDVVFGVPNSILNSAALTFEGTHVFPNLRKLCLSKAPDSYLPFLKFLFSPSLTHLELTTRNTPNVIAALSQLGITCPSMVSFEWIHVSNDATSPALCDSISQVVLCWNRLKKLDVPALNHGAVDHLSHLVGFRHLTLQHGFAPDSVKFSGGFESLRSLNIKSGVSLGLLIDFMRSSHSSIVEKVWVYLREFEEPTRVQWKEYFDVLAKRSSAAEEPEFRTFRTPRLANVPAADHTSLMEADMLRPLLAVRNLSVLDLSNWYHFNITDGFIEELTKACPWLMVLNIGTEHTTGGIYTMTLKSYMHALQNCRGLTTLGLVVDTSTACELLVELPHNCFNLRGGDFELCVGDSEVGVAENVANILAPFFCEPLGELSTAINSDRSIVEGWRRVKDYLDGCFSDSEIEGQ